MTAYWITFTDAQPACAYTATEEEARTLAAARGTIKAITTLPHPARPRLDANDGWGAGQSPSFCHAPEKCSVVRHCPGHRSCTE